MSLFLQLQNFMEHDLSIHLWFSKMTKVHSFLIQCLQDLWFMKTRYFQETFPSWAKLTSAEVPCFLKLNNTVLRTKGFYVYRFCSMELYNSIYVDSRDEFELEFSSSSKPELWRFRVEPSRAGHFNFWAETELTMLTMCMSKNSKFLTYFPILLLYHEF